MPWNEPSNNGNNHDPWGNKGNKKDQGPPDLDKFISELIKKIRGFIPHKKSQKAWQRSQSPEFNHSGAAIGIIAVALLIIWFLSGFFIINQAEEGVMLRFGEYSSTLQPGLHWMARFIDTKYLVDVQKIYSFSLQGDFLTKSADQNDLVNPYVPAIKKAVTLGDQSKNLVNVELNVQYRIADPRAYLFNVVDPDSTIQEVAAGALSDIVGQMKLDEVLTIGRENLSGGVLARIKQVLLPYHTGFEVITVTLRKAQAPDQVKSAFNDVNSADQEKATTIQQAQAYASKVIPVAQGIAARMLAEATAYQQQVVLTAQANIAKYEAILKVYSIAPLVTEQRMYFETMQAILQHTSKILIDSNANNLIYLPIDKLMNKESSEDTTEAPRLPTLSFDQAGNNKEGVSNDVN